MMKKMLVYPGMLLVCLSACQTPQDKLAGEYGALLRKEYAEIENSERYKTFQTRYRLLDSLSQEVYESEGIEIANPEKVDTLCFEPSDEWDLQFNQNQEKGKTAVIPFAERVNLSKNVNASIVAENFYTKESLASAFRTEVDLHRVYNILDKDEYLGSIVYKEDSTKAYENFCDDLRLMDRLNNCRYFLIQKDLTTISSEYEDDGKDEFTGGAYIGEVYVYDLVKKKFVFSFPVLATNSDVVKGMEKSIEASIDNDLDDNINNDIKDQISTNFGLSGEVPAFHQARSFK